MRNILETGARKNFIRAALVLPILMGLVPEKDRPRLIELRTRFLRQKEYRKLDVEESKFRLKEDEIKNLKNSATSLFLKNERRAVFIMEKAQREENKLNDKRGSLFIQRSLLRDPVPHVSQPILPPEPHRKKRATLSFLDIPFMQKYYTAKMEITQRLGQKDVVIECSKILKALETAVPGGYLNYP